MPLVEGIQGADPIRYCDLCETHTLQMVGSFYDCDEDGHLTDAPVRFSHIGPTCVVCLDKIRTGELDGNAIREAAA